MIYQKGEIGKKALSNRYELQCHSAERSWKITQTKVGEVAEECQVEGLRWVAFLGFAGLQVTEGRIFHQTKKNL